VSALPAAPACLARAWRFLDSGPLDGAGNMAWDVALLDRARRTGEAVLRVYAWTRPTLSLGRHERALGRFDAAHLRTTGVDVVRRPTGGRALLHHREVTYSVTAPVEGLSLGESYRAINEVLIAALRALGVTARPAPRRAAPMRPGTGACFSEPNEGELEAGIGTLVGKLVGSAQWRDEGAFLQHGSILVEDDQSRIASLLMPAPAAAPAHAALAPAGTVEAGVATLAGTLGRRVAYAEVSDAQRDAITSHCRSHGVTSPAVFESDPGMLDAVAHHRDRFGDPAWTWRR
jgi:lipoate-protein ligase A